jgi:hypothetical protein
MKKYLFLSMTCITALLTACGNKGEAKNEVVNSEEIFTELPPGEELNFEEIFTELPPKELQDNVFKLFSEDYTVITAGDPIHYNSMTAGWGGLGILDHVPAAYCVLRANRYTLELMRQNNTYTLSFFPDEYKEQVFFSEAKAAGTAKRCKRLRSLPYKLRQEI